MYLNFQQLNTVHTDLRVWEAALSQKLGFPVRLAVHSTSITDRNPEELVAMVANALQMPHDAYKIRSRRRAQVDLRFLACLFLNRYFPNLSMREIGGLVGLGDHSSVLNALNRAKGMLDVQDTAFYPKYVTIKTALEQWLSPQ